VAHPLLTNADPTVLWCMEPYAGDYPTTLAEFLQRPAWHARALSRGQAAGEWVSAAKTPDYSAQRAICGRCPVRQQCLESALADPSLLGLRGGTDEKERRELRRRARVA
jgi:Transcription factor WhiB